AKVHALATDPGPVGCVPDPAVAVLPAGRANYQVLGIGGRFGEIVHGRLCGRDGGEQREKSKKEVATATSSGGEEGRIKKWRHTIGLKSKKGYNVKRGGREPDGS